MIHLNHPISYFLRADIGTVMGGAEMSASEELDNGPQINSLENLNPFDIAFMI